MNRPIHVRMFVALAIASTIGALGLSNASPRQSLAAAPVVAVESTGTIPTLPTVRVHPPVEIPTLPLVVVRPTPGTQPDRGDSRLVASNSGSGPALGIPDVLPHVRLDMPYYSFGKLMPRAIKE